MATTVKSPGTTRKALSTFPFYAKASLLLIGLYVFISMLSIAQAIILPVLYATLVAIIISPVINWLVRKKIHRTMAIVGVLAVAFLVIAAIVAFLSSQAIRLSEALPQLITKFQELFQHALTWASGYFNISPEKINAWLTNAKQQLTANTSANLGNTLSTMGGLFATVVLTPVYVFMLLFYQSHLTQFIHKLFGASNNSRVDEVLTETRKTVQSYLIGLFFEFVIVAVMNSLGLLILGIDYAILLGLIGALLNLIPYLGGVVGMSLFMLVALLTKSPIYVFYVAVMFTLVQLVDNNFIVPRVVGSKVKLNALTSILVVIAGAALWGIPGMFLAIPIMAIVKLILDRIESVKPWGFLLGHTVPLSKRRQKALPLVNV